MVDSDSDPQRNAKKIPTKHFCPLDSIITLGSNLAGYNTVTVFKWNTASKALFGMAPTLGGAAPLQNSRWS